MIATAIARCGCGKSLRSLAREYDHIEETIGRRSAEEFEATHERHADLLDRYQDDSPEWVRRARARALPTRVER